MFEAAALFSDLVLLISSSAFFVSLCAIIIVHTIDLIPSQYYNTMDTGLNSRMGAQALIQSSVFENVGKKAIFSESSDEVGYVVAEDVVLGGESQNTALTGTLSTSSIPYKFTLLGSGKVASTVPGEAGQILSL